MLPDSLSPTTRQARFHAGWLALLPTLPLLSVLALGSLRWKALHPQFKLIFTIFAVTQIVAAGFTPVPLLSLLLAVLRLLLLLGLIGVGSRLQTRHLSWLLLGLGIVYLTAYLDAFLGQRSASLLNIRLLHPFLTPPSLGLAGAFGVLICMAAWKSALWWRLPMGLLALSVCVLSGSRAPLLGLLVALLVLLVGTKRRGAALLLGGLAFLAVGAAGKLSSRTVLERFSNLDNSDRDLIWSNTLSVVAAHPLGGVGPYQLGESLLPPGQRCELWPSLALRGVECPTILTRLQGAWLIAHNLILHPLAETGLIGLLGYALLLGLAMPLMLRSSPLIAGLSIMLLITSLVDNVLLIPSPFFAEAFWIALGIAQHETVNIRTRSDAPPHFGTAVLPVAPLTTSIVTAGWFGLLLAGLYLFPLWTSLYPHNGLLPVQIVAVSGTRQWTKTVPYRTYVMLRGHGQYRIVLRGCLNTCRTLSLLTVNLDTSPEHVWDDWMQERLPFSSTEPTELRLELYPLNAAPISIQPLARRIWSVNLK